MPTPNRPSKSSKRARLATCALPHAELTPDDTQCIRTFDAVGADNLIVTSKHDKTASGAGRVYEVTLQRRTTAPTNDEYLPYSLFNLGIQGRLWRVQILEVEGKNVVLTRPKRCDSGRVVETEMRGPFGTRQPSGAEAILDRIQPKGSGKNSQRVWLIKFDGKICKLTVRSFRPDATPQKSEHDISPPPPEGGGDEGSDENKKL